MSDIEVVRNVTGTSPSAGSTSKTAAKSAQPDAASARKVDAVDSVQPNSEQVELTAALQRLEELSASLADEPIVDELKVEAIKQGLSDGSYTVNSEQIANKLIELELLLK